MNKRWILAVCAACAVVSARAIQVADSLVVNLDVANLTLNNGDYVRSWANPGTAGGVFTNLISGKGPIFQTNVGGAPAVTFQAYDLGSVMTNMAPVPATIAGTDNWSWEAWVYNPSLSQTEIVFSWTARNAWPISATGSCVEFRYGADTGNACEHYGNNIPWYTGPNLGVVPAVGAWHHVAATRDPEGRERLFVDGQMKAITTPLIMHVRTDGVFTLGATRDYAYTNLTSGQAWISPYSGSIAKFRVHAGTLSAADVVANYNEERGAFGVSVVPDSTWNGAANAALPWEDASNWAGGVPTADSRVNIANGGTAVVSTAVGSIGRFLPFHGGLILSNNASLTALPWQNPGVNMGNGSNNFFSLILKEGSFAVMDYTNANHLYFGISRGTATGVIGGGTLPAVLEGGRDVQLGSGDGSVSRMTVENNGSLYTSNGWIYVGCSGRADAKLTVNNGGFVGHRKFGLDIVVSDSTAYGVLEVNSGGVVAPSQDFNLTRGNYANAYGAIQLNSGGLIWFRRMYPGSTTGTNILFMNGGTLRNRDSRTDFIQSLDWGYVQAGGAVFDIMSNTAVTVFQPLLADPVSTGGGLTKIGNGTLTLAGTNTFTGNISVQGGLLALSNSAALPAGYAGTVSVSAGASIGYAKAGGVAELLPRIDTSSQGSLTLFAMNAGESVDLSAYPGLSLGFSGAYGNFTYTGAYTPYGGQYKFAPQASGAIYSAAISGAASVTLNGALAGTLELSGNNSYTGGTTINGGMLIMSHVNACGDPATVTIPDIGIYNGAALKLNATGIPTNIVQRIKPDSQGYLILGAAYTNFDVNLTGLPGIRVGTDQANLYYSGVITPESNVYRTGGGLVAYASSNYGLVLTNLVDNGVTPRTLVVDGVGMVRPAGTYNNYSGGTVVSNNGALHLREDSGLGKVPTTYDPANVYVNKGVFRPGSSTFSMSAYRGLTVGPDGMILHPNGSQTFTMLGGLHGSGAITNTDSGTVYFGGTNNSYNGRLTLNSGTAGPGNGTTFSWNTNALVDGNSGTFVVNYHSNLVWSANLGAALCAGGYANIGFKKMGSGLLLADVPQFYWGTTTVDDGTLRVGTPSAIPEGYNRGSVTINAPNTVPARLDVNGYNLTINGLSGSGSVTDTTATATSFTVGDNNAGSSYNGKVAPNLTVTKVGTSMLSLNKGTQINNLTQNLGPVTLWPGAEVTGSVSVASGQALNICTNANELNGLVGEYWYFGGTAPLQALATVTTLVSLAKFNEAVLPYAPTLVANSSISNVFSFGSGGAFFQNAGNYRVARWTGKFLAEQDGQYKFNTLSDDGSMVWINGNLVVSNDFSQGYTTTNSAKMMMPIQLKAGWHDILIGYYNGTGSYGLTVFMTPPGGSESELPQRLLRPASVKIGKLTGGTNAVTTFFSPNAALTLRSDENAVYDGILTGTNALSLIEKYGSGSQTIKRVAFQGYADVREGALALQGSPMMGGAVQNVSGPVAVSNGASFVVRSYAPDWPNAGLASEYFNIANFNSSVFAPLSSLTNTFYTRIPDLFAGTYLAGPNFNFNPNTIFPPPYNSSTFIDFQALYQGKLVIREAGTYVFKLVSDDRSDMSIDGVMVVSNSVSGTSRVGTNTLAAGTHDILIPFSQGSGGYNIYATVIPPGGSEITMPNAMFRPCVGQVGSLTVSGLATVGLPDMGSYLRINQTTNTTAEGTFNGVAGAEVEKTGPSRLTLLGDNAATYAGGWFISQGELWAGDGATSGSLGGSNVYVSGGAALVFNRSDDIVYNGAIAGKGEIRSVGAGKLFLGGTATNFAGTVNVGSGSSVTLARTLTSTNATVVNNGSLGISSPLAYLSASRITGSGSMRLDSGAVLGLGPANMNYGSALSVSNGVLALAITNSPSDWHLSRLTLEAGTMLEVCSSGLRGRFYDVPSGDAGAILSNAFLTLTSVTNYFAPKTPAVIASSWLQGEGFDFGADSSGTAGTAFFPGKYHNATNTSSYNFAALWQGKIRITEPGTYTFGTASDDGSMIFIDGATVVNNAGSHGMTTKTGAVALTAGLHDITLCFQQGTGGFGLYATVQFPSDTAVRRLPNGMLVEDASDTPAYSLTVDAIAVTNGPGAGTVSFTGPGTLKMSDLWVDTGARLAVTGSVAVAGSALNVTVPQQVPYGITVVGDFTATPGLDLTGVTQTLYGSAQGTLRYGASLLYIGRSSGSMLILK